jgi:uncharacterized DUF497 family protein
MRYGWDENKRRQNLLRHGVDFAAVHRFDWRLATAAVDAREDYGELREVAKGFIGAVLHVLVFTSREDAAGELIWVISLRKATRKEHRDYEREAKA